MQKRKVSITKPLIPPGPWPIFYDERYDPAKEGGEAGGSGADRGGTATPIVYEPSAAEQRRGFPLEYVMASAGLYADDDGYVLGLDMIETYDGETEVEVTFQKFNSADQPIDDNGETRPDFDARVGREIARQTDIMEAYRVFPQWYQEEYGVTLQQQFERQNRNREAFGNHNFIHD
ncbi:hypothetical protein [Tautonia plasticadhaerens]|uniref:Uncharacterized protein n=1 Tax=Tautonia plasticadhaerens TaxID=2527974 RepID=A0A518HFH4_9BACT|nr:hypothetical protein [Tautonia plasticadhaerens]QDV39516.1 hypothetical protein ElP_74850 [Tautonia plasticadhaerens]QDV39546.1 hypothetical protein ElP_75170 [Tautonia plasticadhaerens]